MKDHLNKFSELKLRILFLLFGLLVFRIGSHIPVPGIDYMQLLKLFKTGSTGVLELINMFSGGSLSRFTIFALGIMPYISASILMQLSKEIFPFLSKLKKEDSSGVARLTQYTRYATVILAVVQSFGIASMLVNMPSLVLVNKVQFFFTTILCLTTGTIFLMWLGEQITERGIGNGNSIIITAGIISGLPSALTKTFSLVSQGSMSILSLIFIIALIVAVTFLVIFIERAQRKIPVEYARKQVGNRIMQPKSSYLPLKINMSGVIPPIFASSIMLLPGVMLGWFGKSNNFFVLQLIDMFRPGSPLYIVLYFLLIVFFCFFYTALVFKPKDTSNNLRKSSGFIPGIRPGENTTKYIEKIVIRLTLIGAIYVGFVCLIPEFLILKWSVPFYFGGTSLLIIIVVIMDFLVQLQSSITSVKYEKLLKKVNDKGFGFIK